MADLDAGIALMRSLNPRLQVLLTVSPVPLKQAVPMVAAAAVLFVVVGSTGVTDDANLASASMLEDVVQLHSSQLPSDIPDVRPD